MFTKVNFFSIFVNVSFGTPLKSNIEDRSIVHIDIGSLNFEGLYRGVMGDNRQRKKTPGQVVNEFEEVLDIMKERNKETQGVRTDLNDEDNFSSTLKKSNSDSDSWSEAAESFDTSVGSLSKGTKVKQIAEEGEYEHRGEPVEVDEEVQEVAEKAKREKGIFDY
jgi:hypothetical protein